MCGGFKGCLAKRSHLSLLCLPFIVWYKYFRALGILQVTAMLLNYADADLFNSQVTDSNKGIHHKRPDLHSARPMRRVCFPVTPNDVYNPNHIMLFRWTFSSPNTFWKLRLLNRSCHHQLIGHSSGKRPRLEIKGAWRRMNIDNWEMTWGRDNGRHRCDCKWKRSISVTFWKEGSWEKALGYTI